MTTSSSLDARSLAHRLTAVGHALHHRLLDQLRESDLDPRTLAILRVIDGRLDAPWVSDRIARGGKRVAALAERGWIERVDDAWTLTDAGRTLLDRVGADRAALLSDLPADALTQIDTSIDALADALGVDATAPGSRGFRGGSGRGFWPGSGPAFGRGFGSAFRGHRHDADHGEHARPAYREHDGLGEGHGEHNRPAHGEHDGRGHGHDGYADHGHGEHARPAHRAGHGGCDATRRHGHGAHRDSEHRHGGGHRAHRATQRAFERGFDAGFVRGREATASE